MGLEFSRDKKARVETNGCWCMSLKLCGIIAAM